jgi:hypothetical protein
MSASIKAQDGTIRGRLENKDEEALAFATVMLLNPTDSVMVHFTTTNEEGRFTFSSIEKGSYLMQCSYLGYNAYWKALQLKEPLLDVGRIALENSETMLTTIEVTGEIIPMKIGDDTVTFNTAAFPSMPGDVVEDLLQRMPGIEVSRDGTLKAFGKDVENVLVDGKEFFGKDTRIATKNLEADAIEKIEVFDKKSDQAEFTGIDDGQEERSLNLQLKEDRKVGYFGNVEAAAGTDKRFKTKSSLNRFRPDQRLSFIGLGNNINEQGFSFTDYMDFMGGIGAFMNGGGGRFEINESSGLPLGLMQNQGVQRTWAGGLNYNQSIGAKSELTSSVFLNEFRNDLDRSSLSEQVAVNDVFNTEEKEDNQSNNFGISGNFRLDADIDSSQNIILRGAISTNLSNYTSDLNGQSFREDFSLVNELNRSFLSEQDNYSGNTSLTYRKRFRKPGRTLVSRLDASRVNNLTEGTLQSQSIIFTEPSFYSDLNQNQLQDNETSTWSGRLSMTEGLGRNLFLQGAYLYSQSKTLSQTQFFDLPTGGAPVLNTQLSNEFEKNYTINDGGLRLAYTTRKLNASFGVNLHQTQLQGIVDQESDPIEVNNLVLLPNIYIRRKTVMNANYDLSYSTFLNEPDIRQLQPRVYNQDPLNIYIGNPNLRPEFVHEVRSSYMSYDAFSFRMISASLSGTYTHNRITEVVYVDENLARTIRPENVDRDYGLRGSFSFDSPIRPLRIDFKSKFRLSYNNGIIFLNGIENTLESIGSRIGFSIENRKKDKLDVLVGIDWRYSENRYSELADFNQSFDEYTLNGQARWKISDRWDVRTNIDHVIYGQSFSEEVIDFTMLTASLSTYLSQEKKIKLTFSVFDLLNQNNGVSRNANLNYSELERTNVLGRYFLLGLNYNLRGFAKKKDVIEFKRNED